MSITKQPKLVLATSLLAKVSDHKFLRNIMLYNEKNTNRLLSKQLCEWVDLQTSSLMVRSIAVLKCFSRCEEERTAIKRRVMKCCNLTSLIMAHEDVFVSLTCFDFLKDLLLVSPNLNKIQSSHVCNWLVKTSMGMKLYNCYGPDPALTVDNVVEIIVLSLMAEDTETLSRFYHLPMHDLVIDGYCISMKSQVRINDNNLRICLHYTDGSNRPLSLKLDVNTGIWQIIHIGRNVSDVRCVICEVCSSM